MSESVNFWLDNKMSAGIKVAELDGQLLVTYRDKFYVVVNGAAQMKGSRALHYTRSSLPAIWRNALKKETLQPQPATTMVPVVEPPVSTAPENELAGIERIEPMSLISEQPAPRSTTIESPKPAESTAKSRPPAKPKTQKPNEKSESMHLTQEFVEAKCPYCSHRNEILLDKGKRAKPFFTPCAKCGGEFAVRLVQVTMYQAQVAGFR